MQIGYRAIRLVDCLRAIRLSRKLIRHDSWTLEQLQAHQQEALKEQKRHAAANSAFWRERLAADPPPVLHKATLMERFDEAVADRRLSRARLEAHLARLADEDELLDADFRVMATSGTTGYRGVFAYSRAEWVVRIANGVRAQDWIGLGTLPRRRVAVVATGSPLHIGARYAMSTDIGLHRVRRSDPRSPLAKTVADMREHQPDQVVSYPSTLAMLAEEQLAGRLAIAPKVLMTTSEVLTEGMEAALRDAWPQARLQNIYSTTEFGMTAAACEYGSGMHLFEDVAIFENVDAEGNPVADGELGSSLLLTDLTASAQPKIRYTISDAVVLTSEPCPCGRPFRRIVSIAGRSDDILELPDETGGTVRIHPAVLRSEMAAQAGVLQYQVVHERDGLHVGVVPRAGAAEALAERIGEALEEALRRAGARAPVDVRLQSQLERDPGHGAKLKVVRSALT